MVTLVDLLLPILVSSIVVFFVSSLFHMVLPIHKNDYKQIPGEDDVRAAIRNANVPPGEYMLPCPKDMKDCQSPEILAKMNEGPVGVVIIRPNGPMQMGKALLQWFIYSLVVGFVAAYVASFTISAGAEYSLVFRVTGTIAIAIYALSNVMESIWKGVSWKIALKFVGDGIAYGLVTGATLAWLWPEAL
ncbi:MAG TPA: hypothetical protein EYQ27_09080 [Gemmatimonadetes bacterium]|nr:hypothetical protein [Gemmatimonadota bacterium]